MVIVCLFTCSLAQHGTQQWTRNSNDKPGSPTIKTKVFKITLPCSGKVTDEVDVQVLINILGAIDDSQDLPPSSSSSSSSSPSPSSLNSDQGQLDVSPSQMASADAMQSDQASDQQATASNQHIVSYTLAIKRKKICTVHPVPVQPRVHQPSKNQQLPSESVNKWSNVDWPTQSPTQVSVNLENQQTNLVFVRHNKKH